MPISVRDLLESKRWVRFGGFCGVLGPILSIGLVVAATLVSPWFSWESNALSDLGVSEAAPVFNGGVILGGILILPFTLALRAHLPRGRLTAAGALILFIGGVSLALVGVFTEDFGSVHTIVALGYFILVPVGLLLLGLGAEEVGTRTFSVATGIVALLAIFALPFALPESITGIAIPEIAEALVISVWIVVTGGRLLRSR